MFFFFFSSRRRHTRLQGDWSSDVCSSDLSGGALDPPPKRSTIESGRALPHSKTCPPPHMPIIIACVLECGGAPPIFCSTRSEERRVGEEGRSRGSPYHLKKKKNKESEMRA